MTYVDPNPPPPVGATIRTTLDGWVFVDHYFGLGDQGKIGAEYDRHLFRLSKGALEPHSSDNIAVVPKGSTGVVNSHTDPFFTRITLDDFPNIVHVLVLSDEVEEISALEQLAETAGPSDE